MAIFVNADTKVVVQGLTGGQGKYHGLRNKAYGTKVVGGVTPGKAGQDVEGVPIFNTVHDAVAKAGANTSMIFVPPRFAKDAIYEALIMPHEERTRRAEALQKTIRSNTIEEWVEAQLKDIAAYREQHG